MSIDPQTGYDDDYDEAIKWVIQGVVDAIHEKASFSNEQWEALYHTVFQYDTPHFQEIQEVYQSYLDDMNSEHYEEVIANEV